MKTYSSTVATFLAVVAVATSSTTTMETMVNAEGIPSENSLSDVPQNITGIVIAPGCPEGDSDLQIPMTTFTIVPSHDDGVHVYTVPANLFTIYSFPDDVDDDFYDCVFFSMCTTTLTLTWNPAWNIYNAADMPKDSSVRIAVPADQLQKVEVSGGYTVTILDGFTSVNEINMVGTNPGSLKGEFTTATVPVDIHMNGGSIDLVTNMNISYFAIIVNKPYDVEKDAYNGASYGFTANVQTPWVHSLYVDAQSATIPSHLGVKGDISAPAHISSGPVFVNVDGDIKRGGPGYGYKIVTIEENVTVSDGSSITAQSGCDLVWPTNYSNMYAHEVHDGIVCTEGSVAVAVNISDPTDRTETNSSMPMCQCSSTGIYSEIGASILCSSLSSSTKSLSSSTKTITAAFIAVVTALAATTMVF